MKATLVILVLWILFAATHMTLSSLRPRLVAALGQRGFLSVYSVVAFATFVPLVAVYLRNRHQGPLLWALPLGDAGLWGIYALQAVAWTLVLGGLVVPSPASVGHVHAGWIPVQGLHRVTRHALFMGTGLFGALHLPVTGFASDVAFWAGLPLFAGVGCRHQDRRKLATEDDAFRAWFAETSFVPLASARSWRGLRGVPLWLPVAGVALATLLRWLHGPLFH